MSLSMHTVLVELVESAGESDEPVSPQRLAESLAEPEPEVSDSLESLREFELVAATPDGYRPTVTAHDLLAIDIELDETLVLDIVDS